MRKRLGIIMVGFLVVSTLALAGCGSKPGGPVTINKATAQIGKLTGGAVVSGKLEAVSSANVVPKTGGVLASIQVDVGSVVKAGDLLAKLDDSDYTAAVNVARAQLAKTRDSDLPTQQTQAQLSLANAQSTFKTAEADYQRNKDLRAAGAISPQQLEQSEKGYTQAKAALDAAQSSLDILVNNTIPKTLQLLQAQLSAAQVNVDNCVITSPISGVVTAKFFNPGEMVQEMPGYSQPIVTVVSLDPVVVQANVSEDQVNNLKEGQELPVKISAVQDQPFTGTVTNIAQAADPSTKAYLVKIQIPNPQQSLKPGMFAEVQLNSNNEDGIVIPREALTQGDNNKSFVWVISNGQVSKREVVPGQSDDKNVLIKSGLKAGEDVAVTNIDTLQEGAKVNIQN